MSDWQITTLGEIINTGNGLIQTGPFGSQLHASDYVSLGVPVIMPINLVDNRISLDDVAYITDDDANRLAKHILKAGDIVYSRRGDVTRKALITEKEEGMFCGTGCLLIRPGYKVESKFLAYFLSTPSSKEWIIRHAVGATMPNLNTSILSKVPLLLPDFSMQKRIAKILGDLDNKITLNRQINQTLEAMAQALFKSWFVDFDPVKAKLSALAAGGSANDANLAAMSAISGKTTEQLLTLKTTHPDQFQQLYTTADLFPSEMVDSELGEIPKGWEVSEIGKEVTVVGGGTPSTSNSDFWENGDVFWATPKDLSSLSDKVIIDTERKITQQGLSKICRVSTGWMSYNYLKSQYLLEGCKSEILEFLQPD
ncbi:MAG: restriction endonuclease subunit S [Gammaproteobacteria bacterium]|nr:restriction endonuclease subunit S [Gammaproteobacteria bacterium]